jgi:hypothetical protein
LGLQAGIGIMLNGGNAKVVNNYIQTEGLGVSKGITLGTGASGAKVVFNSVNVTGVDEINGRALEILGGDNYVIKNNIFSKIHSFMEFNNHFPSDLMNIINLPQDW